MKLAYHQPHADLRPYIGAYYSLVANTPVQQPMCAEFANVRFIIDGAVELIMPDESKMAFYDATLIGPTMNWVLMQSHGPVEVFGVGILPRGWGAFFGPSAYELHNKVVDFEGVCGPLVKYAMERMRNTDDTLQKILVADDLFHSLLDRKKASRVSASRMIFPETLDAWLLQPEDLQLDHLLAHMDVSRRQTERLAKQFFGASPKGLQRKYRALHAASQLILEGNVSWLDIEGGDFYDQSHFIKEIKAFTGMTPKQLIAGEDNMMIQSIKMRSRATHQRPIVSNKLNS